MVLLRLLLHGCKVTSTDKIRLIAVRVLRLWLPAISIRDRLTTENIGNNAADGRKVFGAVEGSPGSTDEVLKLRVPGNDGILGFGDAVPAYVSSRCALVRPWLPTKKIEWRRCMLLGEQVRTLWPIRSPCTYGSSRGHSRKGPQHVMSSHVGW